MEVNPLIAETVRVGNNGILCSMHHESRALILGGCFVYGERLSSSYIVGTELQAVENIHGFREIAYIVLLAKENAADGIFTQNSSRSH